MECVNCGEVTKVLETRRFDGMYLRRRKCPRCGEVMWTNEVMASMRDVRDMQAYEMIKRRAKKSEMED